jgi:hypothetical protein
MDMKYPARSFIRSIYESGYYDKECGVYVIENDGPTIEEKEEEESGLGDSYSAGAVADDVLRRCEGITYHESVLARHSLGRRTVFARYSLGKPTGIGGCYRACYYTRKTPGRFTVRLWSGWMVE